MMVMAASFVAAPSTRPRVRVADDEYVNTVLSAVRARLRQVSSETSEPLESVLGNVSEVAERLAAAVPTASTLAAEIGPVYRQASLAKARGCSRQAIGDWVRHRRVLALTTSDNVVVIPAFQLDSALGPLPGLEAVLSVLTPDVVDDWTLASWLGAPQPLLGGDTVIARVRACRARDADVIAVIEAVRERWVR